MLEISDPEMLKHFRVKDNKQLVGIMLTTCNDVELTKVMIPSLFKSLDQSGGYPYHFIVIDSGSTDGTLEYLRQKRVPTFGPHLPTDKFPHQAEHLCQALNAGIKMFLGYNPETGEFETKDGQGYICWVHADMEFLEEDWLEKLVNICEADPTIGKLGPDDWGAVRLPEEKRLRSGNTCPWIIPVHALLKLWENDGMFFDENYWFTQNYDDWDLNRRLINYGYKILIANDVRMKHEGMGTRKNHQDPKYEKAAVHNRRYYINKWGDCTCPV